MKGAVLTTNNVDCRGIVKDGLNGLICFPNGFDHFAAKMNLMINMDERAMGING